MSRAHVHALCQKRGWHGIESLKIVSQARPSPLCEGLARETKLETSRMICLEQTVLRLFIAWFLNVSSTVTLLGHEGKDHKAYPQWYSLYTNEMCGGNLVNQISMRYKIPSHDSIMSAAADVYTNGQEAGPERGGEDTPTTAIPQGRPFYFDHPPEVTQPTTQPTSCVEVHLHDLSHTDSSQMCPLGP